MAKGVPGSRTEFNQLRPISWSSASPMVFSSHTLCPSKCPFLCLAVQAGHATLPEDPCGTGYKEIHLLFGRSKKDLFCIAVNRSGRRVGGSRCSYVFHISSRGKCFLLSSQKTGRIFP